MEGNVCQLFAGVVTSLLNLLKSSSSQKSQSNGGVSPNVPATGAASTLTSTNATSLVLVLSRNQKTADGLFGSLNVNGKFFCYTMENLALSIPAGRYGLALYDSPHAGHVVPILKDVPNRNEIEIHCGNIPQDSKGCIIVGDQHTGDTLGESREAFDRLFPLIQASLAAGPQFIDIIDM